MHTQTLRTLLTLPLLIALTSPVLAEDDKVLLAKCDVDRNGPTNDLPPAAWTMIEKKRVCMHEYELDQLAKFMPNIRQRCDLNGNGRIDHAEPLTTPLLVSGKETNGRNAYRSLPEGVRKQVDAEKKCVQDASIAQKDASIAQDRAEIAKLEEILALLNPAEARAALAQDIRKTEQWLQEARERKDKGRCAL